MKILLITEYYFPKVGGAETAFKELAERLVKLGNEIHILTCKLPGTKGYEELNGVRIHRISVPSRGGRYCFNTLWPIKNALKIGKDCDLIHAGCEGSAFPAWLVAKLLNKRSVITIQEPFGEIWKNLPDTKYLSVKFYQCAEKLLLSLSFNNYVCISQSTKSRVKAINKSIRDDKLLVVYFGIDNHLFDETKANGIRVREALHIHDEFVYMSFGRPGISKGIEFLISAVPQISTLIHNSKLLLILSRSPESRYKRIVGMLKDLSIENDVILLEPVPREELPNYIAAANCVVVPSLSEGFGFTAAEACAMDKPVVVSNAGSLPEVVSGEWVLIEPRNTQAIADGVMKIARGETQHSAKKTFSWDECAQKYSQVYKDLTK